MHIQFNRRGGFALPTVLIASVVLLAVLVTASTSVAAVRTSLKVQYYEQLAKSAGESGAAYAKACLAKNGNKPLWTDLNPLTPSTDCAGNETLNPATDCPANDRCSVVNTAAYRSSFKVNRPAVDSSGRALTIPNTGYVELLRASDGSVWRTYRQPAVQAAVVPDLCSGSASSALGWSNARVASSQSVIPGISSAQSITIEAGNVIAGRTFFRKDFPVTKPGVYQVSLATGSGSDEAALSIDGASVASTRGALVHANVNLDAGCHSVTVQLVNKVLMPTEALFTAAIREENAEPIVATDTSWRVTAGAPVDFSSPDFYADSDIWVGSTNTGLAMSGYPAWVTATGESATTYITPSCSSSCPASQSTFFRDNADILLTSADDKNSDGFIDLYFATLCDDNCRVYINGTKAIASSPFNGGTGVAQQTVQLPPGRYRIAVHSYNAGTPGTSNRGAIALLVTNKENANSVVRRTTTLWQTSSSIWIPGFNESDIPYSYESTFTPS